MHTKNVRMRPVPLWGRCTGSTDFTSRKKNTRKTNGATKQHSMRDQRQLWKSFSSSFASFEFTCFGVSRPLAPPISKSALESKGRFERRRIRHCPPSIAL